MSKSKPHLNKAPIKITTDNSNPIQSLKLHDLPLIYSLTNAKFVYLNYRIINK